MMGLSASLDICAPHGLPGPCCLVCPMQHHWDGSGGAMGLPLGDDLEQRGCMASSLFSPLQALASLFLQPPQPPAWAWAQAETKDDEPAAPPQDGTAGQGKPRQQQQQQQ